MFIIQFRGKKMSENNNKDVKSLYPNKIANIHSLKCINPYFDETWLNLTNNNGIKTFKIKLNDRNFKINDIVYLREFLYSINKFTDRVIKAEISYILKDCKYIKDNYVILQLINLENLYFLL